MRDWEIIEMWKSIELSNPKPPKSKIQNSKF